MHQSRHYFGVGSILIGAAHFALLGRAMAQSPTQGGAATNSLPAVVVAPDQASNQAPQTISEVDKINSLRQKAAAGDAESQFKLGEIYETGKGIPKNPVEAAKWYGQAAEQGNAQAQLIMGLCYVSGYGVPKDAAMAAKWYQKSAEQGNPGAQFVLGLCYANGDGVEKDVIVGASWFRKSAEQGNSLAQGALGSDYYSGIGVDKDVAEAAKWFGKAADQGNAHSQFILANMYATGEGVNQDDAMAISLYRKSADQAYSAAQTCLGDAYYRGNGVKKDLVEAAKWFSKAANQGDANAQHDLGVCYANGQGVEKNQAEALKWYRKAAAQGVEQAQFNLGKAYMTGDGVEKNPVEGANWYRKSAYQGDPRAQLITGFNYILGSGVIKDEVEGLAWMYLASANGDEMAMKNVSTDRQHFSETIISAARQRATDLQGQIASQRVNSVQDDSPAPTFQPPSAPNSPKSSGSGAFISADGLILTSAHVVQGASRIEVVTAAGTLDATVVKIDATTDVALLKCTGSSFPPLPIAPSKDARAGKTVFTVGFPNIQVQGFDPKLTKGEISSQAGFQDDPTEWQISVPIQPGNSGGPLCDENGNLIGVIEETLNPLTMAKIAGEIPQDVNYAVKSSYILPLLEGVQNLPPPHPATEGTKFEDVVGNVQKSAVLILVY